MSTDHSVKIAKSLGCVIESFDTGGALDETKLTDLRNTVWNKARTRWVIVCDMDELLAVNQNDILKEQKNGTTILTTKGYDIIGDSKRDDLSDIKPRLDKLTKASYLPTYSKQICFDRTQIARMNFDGGSHTANPIGNIQYSTTQYFLYHYKKLGFKYYKFTHERSAPRSELAKSNDIFTGSHYTRNVNKMQEQMNLSTLTIETVPALETFYMSN